MRSGVGIALTVLLPGMWPASAARPPADSRVDEASRHLRSAERAVERVTKGSDGFALDDRADAAILAHQWDAVRRLTTALLDRHPAITELELARAMKPAGDIEVGAVRLDRDTVLVGVGIGAFGTVSLFHRGSDGHFRTARALDAAAADMWGALAAWRPDRAASDCRAPRIPSGWLRCGPMAFHNATSLPAEADGARRFALVGRYVKAAGATDGYQLSIWRWDGRRATPLMVRTFDQMAEQPVFVRSGPRDLKIHVKGDYKSFTACGACAGRQMEWQFDLPAKGVTPPAARSLTPDLDAVDALYDRLLHSRPADDLAAPQVIGALAPLVRDIQEKARADGIESSLGLLGSWKLIGSPKAGLSLCFSADGTEPQIFRIETRAGRKYLADIRFAGPDACDGAAAQF